MIEMRNLPDVLFATRRHWNPVGTRPQIVRHDRLDEPYRWRKPARVLVCQTSDLFSPWVPDGFITWAWMAMSKTSMHHYTIFTREADRAEEFMRRWRDLSGESREPKMARGPEATRATHPSGRGQLFAAYLDELFVASGNQVLGGWPTFDWMGGPRWWAVSLIWNIDVIDRKTGRLIEMPKRPELQGAA